MKKRAVCLVAIVLIAIVLVLLFLVARGNNNMTSVSSSEVAFTDIRLADDTLTISGSLLNSAKSYREYAYTIESNTLYLTISAGVINHKYPYGDFTIEIQDVALQNVSAIHLKSDSETKQIYPN